MEKDEFDSLHEPAVQLVAKLKKQTTKPTHQTKKPTQPRTTKLQPTPTEFVKHWLSNPMTSLFPLGNYLKIKKDKPGTPDYEESTLPAPFFFILLNSLIVNIIYSILQLWLQFPNASFFKCSVL